MDFQSAGAAGSGLAIGDGSAASLVAFGVIVVTWEWLALSFNTAYMISGE